MKKNLYIVSLVLISITGVAYGQTDYYWVGGSGNWSDFENHWATSSGGTNFHSSVPGRGNNVFFDSNSGFDIVAPELNIVVIDENASVLNMNWDEVQGVPILQAGTIFPIPSITIYGDLVLNPNLNNNFSGKIIFRATNDSPRTIQSNNITFKGPIEFDTPEGKWLLADVMRLGGDLIIKNGTLLDNGNQIIGNAIGTLRIENGASLYLGNGTNVNRGTTFPTNYINNNINLSQTSTIVYNAGGDQTIKGLMGAGNGSYGNLILSRSSGNPTKTLDANINIRGNLNIDAANTLDVSSNNANQANQIRSISIQGNWSGAGSFIARTGTVTFNGTTPQTITANTNVSPANTNPSLNNFFNIVIDNAAGIILNSPVTVGTNTGDTDNPTSNGSVTFNNGIVTANNAVNLLIFNNNAQAIDAKNSSHVNGYVNKVGDDTFLFPIGNGTIYRPAGVTEFNRNSEKVAYTARYFKRTDPENDPFIRYTEVNPVNNPSSHLPLNGPVVKYEYWNIKLTSTNAGGRLILTWESPHTDNGDRGYLPNPPYQGQRDSPFGLVVAGWEVGDDIGKWNNRGGKARDFSNNPYTGNVTATTATSNRLEYWTIGTTYNALPIELLYFRTQAMDNAVQLTWATATEKDNEYFTIEKSQDAVNFTEVSRIPGSGNSKQIKKYTATDFNPYNGISYYRLKQTDRDGKSAYSKIESLQRDGKATFLEAKLTAEKQVEINYLLSDTEQAVLTIYDSRGMSIYTKTLMADARAGKQIVPLATASNGLYIITLQAGGKALVKKIAIH